MNNDEKYTTPTKIRTWPQKSTKFNLTFNISGFEMIPLGGIRLKNLNKLKLIRSDSFSVIPITMVSVLLADNALS